MTQLREAEAQLGSALTHFDRVENEVTTFAAKLEEARAREQTLRENRDLERLETAALSTSNLERLLSEAEAQLPNARDRLRAAEAVANRERAAIAAIPLVEAVAQTQAEMVSRLDELEAIITSGIEELITLDDRLTSELRDYYRATGGLTPPLRSSDLVERGGQPLPTAFDIPTERPGVIETLPLHPLGPRQSQSTPSAWKIFHNLLSRRLGKAYQEQKDREALERIGRRRDGYDPYAYQGGEY